MAALIDDVLIIPTRFRGPAHSGNGGWVSGALAEATGHDGPVTVRLRTPPPLDRPLQLRSDDQGRLSASDGSLLVAQAWPAEELARPGAEVLARASQVSNSMAQEAGQRYRGLADHPFPSCFTCGTGRDPAEALCLRTGRLSGEDGMFATAWTPAEVSLPITWAALDCPGAWAGDVAGRPMVLGTMTARVGHLPQVGAPQLILSWVSGESGRKVFSHTALFDDERQLLAYAEATWILIDPAAVLPH